MKKSIALFLSIVILLATVTACASPTAQPTAAAPASSDSSAPTAPAVEAAPTTAPAAPATTAPEPAAAKRTDLVIAINADIATLHPSDFSASNEMDICNQIYDPLMRITLDGTTKPQPRIAESYEISADGLTYTFHLRSDAKFHDGTPITADDVKFSAELYLNSKYQNAQVAGMKDVKVIDAKTVAFTTETVYSPFLQEVSDIHIASKAYHDKASEEDFANKPVGSGPYKFVSHDLGSKITLQAFDGYYGDKAPIETVTYKIIPDDTTVGVALQTGEIDFAVISTSNFSNLDGKPGVVVDKVPMSRFGFVAMNHEKEPFKNVKFRQAVAYAIDRQNMVDLALDGLGTPNSNILSPLRFGYSDSQPKYDYNPDKAKELLKEMGLATPYDLGTLIVAEKYKNQAQVLQNDLAAVGLNVQIEILEFNAYLKKLMGGDYGMSVLEMSLEGSTQQFELAFEKQYIGAANNARYSDPEVEKWFVDAVAAIDDTARAEIYNKIFTKVQEDAVYVVLYNTQGLYAHSDKLATPPFTLEGRYYVSEFSWK